MRILLNILASLACVGIFGWVMIRWLKKSDEPLSLIVRWVLTAIVLGGLIWFAATARDPIGQVAAVLLAAVCGIVFTILWAPSFVGSVAGMFTGLYDGGDQEAEPTPFYSIANAKRKRGKYQEAIAEIEKQLVIFPENYEGLVMMAEIQAEDLHDLPAALATLERILSTPDHAPANIAFVLGRAADWHLKFSQDPEAARQALERILSLLPDTEQAHVAEQRIAHLATRDQIREQKERTPLALKHYEEKLGLQGKTAAPEMAEPEPSALAAEYVRKLQDFPSDNETREKLAVICADHYGRLDLAVDQLEQLIAAPNQPPKFVAHWLNLRADLELKLTGNTEQAKETLQRIPDLFPDSALAERAISRMNFLKLENRPQEKGHVVKLGNYEQNIGLK